MRNPFTRALSLVLTLVLVLSLVPAVAFAAEADTTENVQSSVVAINTTTGKTYESVRVAAEEAKTGQTVQLTQDVTETTISVYEGTLDLNGYTLKIDYMTCYGDLVDNSEDNTGLLIVPAQRFMLQDYNLQLPVKDGEGYRFVEVKGFNAAMIGDNKYAFQPLFEEDAHQYLAAGTEATGVTIQVQVTWMEEEGQSSKRFVYNDDLLGGYIDSFKPASGKYGKMFTLTQKSTGTYEDIGFEAIVFSDTDVTFNAGISQPEKKEEDEPVVKDEENRLVNPMTIYHKQGSAVVPAGTLLEDGVTKLELTATLMTSTGSNVTVGNGEELLSMDVHVSGISENNTVPVIITLNELAPEFLNKGNLALYHVEDGVTMPMTRVYSLDEVDAHNEYYYDIPTGTVTVAMATFSELTLTSVIDKAWMGEVDHSWYVGKSSPYYIANADQLWSFSQIVGGMAEGIEQDTFEGKTVKLLCDINLDDTIDENGKVFYPIGYYNSEKTYEKTGTAITSGVTAFRGTFDGQGHTIKNFYQNTWEMKGDDPYYAASEQRYNDAMGLFSATYDATIKNLVIENFSCDGEYTPTGCVVAYAGGNSEFTNITLLSCNPRVYNTANGGIVGLNYCSTAGKADHLTFKNITVDNTNKISALWGSWDVGCGGLVGRIRENSKHDGTATWDNMNTVSFDNCHVSAQIDVYNDVCGNYQYYQYRYSGMYVGTVDYMDEIPAVGLEEMFFAKDCSVRFGTWNQYWYCELVANSLASYTHDHQFSRLEKIGNKSEIWDGENWTKTGDFVIANADETQAECFHIRKNADGTLYEHKHTDEGYEDVDINGDGEKDHILKEDHQHIMIPFRQLCAGYGWGASHEYLWGDPSTGGIIVLDFEDANSVPKFTEAATLKTDYNTGETVTIGELFAAINNDGTVQFPIDVDNVQVTVTPASDNSTAGAIYTPDTSDWTKGTLKFTGFGPAKVIINDYYFCLPTTANVNIVPAVELELVSHPVNTYDEKHSEATHIYLQIYSDAELDLADSTFDISNVPAGWTYTSQVGTLNDGTWTGSGKIPGDKALVLGYFTAPAEARAEEAAFTNVDLNVMGAQTSADAIVTETIHMGHYGTWIPWTSDTTMPTAAGHYYLTKDVTLSRQAEIKSLINVVVCLNGHTVTANVPDAYSDRIYYVVNGGNLTICDCTAHEEDGVYTAGKLTGASEGAIMMPNLKEDSQYKENNHKTTVTLYDGLLTENHLVVNGGAVLVQRDATFNMYGGQIRGNTNVPVDGKDGMGSGVYVGTYGSFNMYNGVIADNTSLRGSGIWGVNHGKVNIYGGKISGNKTWKDNTDDYLNVTDANGEDAKYTFADDGSNAFYHGSGAGMFLDTTSTVHIENATFENNIAWIRGGAIFSMGADIEIEDSTFTGNQALAIKHQPLQTTPLTTEESTPAVVDETLPSEDNTTGGDEDVDIGDDNTVEGEGGDDGGLGGETQNEYKLYESTGSGGAIFANSGSNLTIVRTTFEGNKAKSNSGAVGVTSGSTALFQDVKIRNNEIESVGGAGIYTAGYTTLTIEGDETEITGNFGQTENRTAVGGIYIANGFSTVTIKGSPLITGNGFVENGILKYDRSIYLQDNAGRTYVDDNGVTQNTPNPVLKIRNLKEGTQMIVRTATEYTEAQLSSWLDWKDENYDPSNKDTYYGTWDTTYLTNTRFPDANIWEDTNTNDLVMFDVKHGEVAGHIGDEKTAQWTPWFSKTSLPTESGYYVLMNDVTVAHHTKLELPAKDVTLCLNGHTITCAETNKDYGSIYYVTGTDHQLTVCDCSATGSATEGTLEAGKITGANQIAIATPNITSNETKDENAGTVITLRDIIFEDNYNEVGPKGGRTGGAVLVQELATLNASNILFRNNGASFNAGAVYIDRGDNHQLSNCAFIGNTAEGHGSAIYLLSGKTTLTGCKITGNKILDADGTWTLEERSGAVQVMPDAQLVLNGENEIDGNYQVNLIDSVETTAAESNIYLYNIQKSQDSEDQGGDEHDHPIVRFLNAPAGKVYETESAVPFDAVSVGIVNPTQLTYSNYLKAENCAGDFTVLHTVPKSVESTTKQWDKVVNDVTYVYTETIFTSTQTIAEFVTDLYVYVAEDKAFYQRSHSGSCLSEYHDADGQEWTPWYSATELPTESGNYYLTQNVIVGAQAEINSSADANKAQNVVLCLNGFTVDASGLNTAVYKVSGKNNSLTLCDCTHKDTDEDYVAGKIVGGTKAAVFVPGNADYSSTTICVRDIIFEGNTRTSTEGVLHAQSKVHLYVDGVRFLNNTCGGRAGAIYLGDSNAEIKNSVFTGNSAATYGGAIYSDYNSTLVVTDSEFVGNHAGNMGAAIYAGSGAVTIQDCSFTGNTLADGNVATSGVIHTDTANLTLIGDNTLDYSVSLLAEGKTEVNNIYVGTGNVTFKKISVANSAIDIRMAAKPAEGQLVVGTGEDVNTATFTVYVTAPFTENEVTTDKTYTYLFNKAQNVLVENGHSSTFATYHTGDEATADWIAWGDDDAEKNRLPNANGYYYLTQDIYLTARSDIFSACNITLCLNGFTVYETNDTKPNETWGDVYYVKSSNVTLTVCDCTAHEEDDGTYVAGKITGAEGSVFGVPNDANATDTVIKVRDGIFAGNRTAYNAGAIFCLQDGASAVIEGGLFEENSAKSGGVLYISGDGTVTITGGTFRNNTASVGSGGVLVGGANITITGATMTGNKAYTKGGAICIDNANNTLTLNGGNTITGNMEGVTDTSVGRANDIRHKGTFTKTETDTVNVAEAY